MAIINSVNSIVRVAVVGNDQILNKTLFTMPNVNKVVLEGESKNI